jgi:hypothetical protein
MNQDSIVKKRNSFVGLLISILRVLLVFVILAVAGLYVGALHNLSNVQALLILIYGPLIASGIYWVWKGKSSSIAHKIFGLLFFYIFFSFSYVANLLFAMLLNSKDTFSFVGIVIISLMIGTLILLPYFEEKAAYHFEGKTHLSRRERIFSYCATPFLSAAVVALAAGIHYIVSKSAVIPDAFSPYIYTFILLAGVLAGRGYQALKKGGIFKLRS